MRIDTFNADKSFRNLKEILAGLIDVFKAFPQVIAQTTESERLLKSKTYGYIDTLYFARIKRISLKCLKRVNSRVLKRIRRTRARESHRKVFLEEEEEKYNEQGL